MKYRSDIDGLRALAIISVVIFHMFPKSLTGGFVGVDIFFVISGYLIGSTILREYESGTFSFLKFYQKRFIRIIPLLLVVLITTLIGGYYILLPQEFSSLGRHVGAASTFISNFLLLKEIDYFDAAAELKPLLHLWSLGIEEQFYLVLPFLIMLFGRKEKRKIVLLIATILLSFLYCSYLLTVDQKSAFFRPESRFWQLLLGVLLSKIENYKFLTNSFKKHYSSLGLFLCLIAIINYSGEQVYPGWRAIVPTFGAMLIILSGRDGILNKLFFSNSILVFIGRISYSLYLWHWMIISYCQIIYHQKVPVHVMWLAIGLSLILSIVTYYGVERPLKYLTPVKRKVITIIALIILVLVYITGRNVYKYKIKQTFLPQEIVNLSDAAQDWISFRDLRVSGILETINFENQLVYKRGNGSEVIVFIGDSHLEHYVPRINKLVSHDDSRFTVYFIARPGCTILWDISYVEPEKKACLEYYSITESFLKKFKASKFIISAHLINTFTATIKTYFLKDNEKIIAGENPLADELIIKSLARMIKSAQENHSEVFIVSTIPYGIEFNPSNMLERKERKIVVREFSQVNFVEENKSYFSGLEKLSQQYKVKIINPMNFLCDGDTCSVLDTHGLPIYRDSNHFRKSYVETSVTYLDFLFIH